jgi:glycerate 2-kinase
MHILIAANAMKDSLSVEQVAACVVDGLGQSGLGATTNTLLLADGGNGTLAAFTALGAQTITCTVDDPLGRPVQAAYGLMGHTAIIEMALASGLELLADDERDPLVASTYGTGQLIDYALKAGAKKIIIGLGGSATVDGGIGMLGALGVRFYDADGRVLPPIPASLAQVHRMDDVRETVEIIIAADVDNPLLGDNGAAAVFGPQKGAKADDIPLLETRLGHFFAVVAKQTGVDVRDIAGSGAAGALGAGLMAFFGASMRSGVDLILDYADFDAQRAQADLVITTEGRIDTQTLQGKGPIGIARRARGVPVVVLTGGLAVDEAKLRPQGIHAVMPLVNAPMTLTAALDHAPDLLTQTARRLGYLLQVYNPPRRE